MFGRKKTPKNQEADKTLYTVYHPYARPAEERSWPASAFYQITSIDPSIKHFGSRVERRYLDGRIETVHFARTGFVPPVPKRKKNEPAPPPPPPDPVCKLYQDVTAFLDLLLSFLRESHFIIMERQLPHNYKAVRLSQHVVSYLSLLLKDCLLMPIIVELDSKVKSRYLGCPRGLNERQTKLWLIEKALQLLTWRNDAENAALIRDSKKKDDLADTVCQAEAFFVLIGFQHLTRVPDGASTYVELPGLAPLPPAPEPKKKVKSKVQNAGLVQFMMAGPTAVSEKKVSGKLVLKRAPA